MEKLAKFFRKKKVRITLISICTVVVLVSGFIAYAYPWGRVAKGISINGVSIGGMTQEDAETKIATDNSFDEKIIKFTDASGRTKEVSGLDISLSPDYKKTVEEAMKIGRSGDAFKDAITLSKLVFVPQNMDYKYSCDTEKLKGVLYSFGVEINGELLEYSVEYGRGIVKVSEGIAGQEKDVSELNRAVYEEISNGNFSPSVTLEKKSPPSPDNKSLKEFIYKAPVNATYSITDGAINVTDEVYGVSVSDEEIEKKIDALKNGEQITLRTENIEPEITKRKLYDQLFNYKLGSFTSRYSTSNKSRTANVTLAARLIDGMILAPGEAFSYNKAVGPRTTARGFKEANVYSNGESILGIGGGICQVSSTLYSAVLYADLEVIERQNHSMTVDYMPKGQDATVSYGTIDFKFRNNTDNPIRINAKPSGGVLTVSITGTKPQVEKTVKITNSIVSVIEKTVEEIPDETLAAGEIKTENVGKTGYVVDTYKKVYQNGVEVKSEYVGRSRYKMVPQKRRKGIVPTDVTVSGEADSVIEDKHEEEPTEEKTGIEETMEPMPESNDEVGSGNKQEATSEPQLPQTEEVYETARPEPNIEADATEEPKQI